MLACWDVPFPQNSYANDTDWWIVSLFVVGRGYMTYVQSESGKRPLGDKDC